MYEASGSPFGGMGSDRAREFRAAARHSRWVRFFRRAIPVSLVLVLAMVAAAAYVKPHIPTLPIDLTRVGMSGTKITMEAPRLGGFTRDGRPYNLTARAAAQDLTNPGVLELKDVRAKVEMQNKAVVEVQAATGLYDTQGDSLILKTDITLSSSAGYTAKLSEAAVDIKKNTIVSNAPVEVKLTSGTVNANRLEVSENGDLIRFDNGVKMYVVPPANEATGSTASKDK